MKMDSGASQHRKRKRLTKLLQVSYEKKQCKGRYNRRLVHDTYQEGVKPRLQGQSCIDQKVICGARRAQYVC